MVAIVYRGFLETRCTDTRSADGITLVWSRQVPQAVVDAINKEMGELRGMLESGTAEAIKAKISDLQQALMKIGEALAGKSGGGDAPSSAGAEGGGSSSSSGTYDADVKDEKK